MIHRGALVGLTVLALCVMACGPTPGEVNNSGHEPYRNGDYDVALDSYGDAMELAPESQGSLTTIRATCYIRIEEYGESISSYDESLRNARGELRSRGLFNRGNAAFRMESFARGGRGYTGRCFASIPITSTPSTTWSWP